MSAPAPHNYDDPLPRGIASKIPTFGTYAVFTLNPTATVEALRDPIATEQALLLPTRRYVGMLTHIETIGTRYPCDLALVSQGPPKSSPADGIEEDMFIPIHPSTHPAGRRAVSPKPPLPWDNLYHHTAVSFDVRVATHPEGPMDDSKSPILSLRDLVCVSRTSAQDVRRSNQLEEPEDQLSEYPYGETDAGPESDHWTISAYSECSGNGSDAGRREPLPPWMEDPRVNFTPIVEFDLDLSTVTEFASAEGLSKEIEELERIWKAAKERNQEFRKAKRMQVTQRKKQAQQQKEKGGDVERELESSPTTLQQRSKGTRVISRVTKIPRGAGRMLKNSAKQMWVKAGYLRKAEAEDEVASANSILPENVEPEKAKQNRVLDLLTSCVRWRQPDEPVVVLEKQ
ncbi:hypothetical protein FA95DRAFT_443164 [Auriscalpium vulgare]|uniref:Uncharacterized protein n=1 Tax=Auriscalpium vulgare TaxID=40419 RepID=A0ACB8RG12_9AGAM|nr:hypothetical protein FA95DRAFT_443164 [Auriscalpium vulgare]